MVRRSISRSGQGRRAMSSDGGRIPSRPLAVNAWVLEININGSNFIASPITCMGSKLEYHHCQGARFNPKDCSYWLKGKCLNPRCTFGHHQPHESLFRNPRAMTVPAEPSSSTTIQVADHPPPNNINRHGRQPVDTALDLHKDQQGPPSVSGVKGVERPPFLEKPIQAEKTGQYQFQSKAETLECFKKALEFLKKAKELKGESSHDRIEDSEFFRDVDECAAAWLQGGRTMDFLDHCNDPQLDHQWEKDQHTENRVSKMYRSLHGREQQKTSSERTLDRSSMLKKGKLREESYNELDDDEPVPTLETDQHRGLHGRDEKLLERPSKRTKRNPREEIFQIF